MQVQLIQLLDIKKHCTFTSIHIHCYRTLIVWTVNLYRLGCKMFHVKIPTYSYNIIMYNSRISSYSQILKCQSDKKISIALSLAVIRVNKQKESGFKYDVYPTFTTLISLAFCSWISD
jgi:hypothetical protein